MPTILKGVHVTMNTVLHLEKMKYSDHDILAYPEYTEQMHEHQAHIDNDLVTREMTQWELGLQRLGLLAITHIPHFGHSAKFNACVK